MPQIIQPSFAKGEVGPELYGRVDTAMYGVALKTARNMIIHPYGGASKRGGLRFRAPVKNHTYAPRLIDFLFSTADKYVLEFGDEYIRVLRDGDHVVETAKVITGITAAEPPVVTSNAHGYSNGDEVYISSVAGMTEVNGNRYVVANVAANTFELTDQVDGTNIDGTAFTAYTSGGTAERIYTLSSPYAVEDLPLIKYVQNADVMTLVHPDYEVRELTRTGHAAWTFSIPTFSPATSYPTNVASTAGNVGGQRARYQVTAIGADESLPGTASSGAATITGATAASPVVITAVAHGLETDDEVHIASVDGMVELNGRRFLIDRIDADSFSLRGEDGTGHTAYSANGTATPTWTEVLLSNITGATQAAPCVLTVAAGHGIVANDLVKIAGVGGMVELNNKSWVVSSVTGTTITLSSVTSTGFGAYTSGGAVWKDNTSNNIITWSAVAGATSYRVYKEKNGRYGYLGETSGLTFTEGNILPDFSQTPPTLRNPFFGDGNNPGAVSFYEQRRVFGGTDNEPDTSFFSQPGSHDNMTVRSPVQDDDAITLTLSSLQINQIRHYVPMNDLIALTSGSEWRITAGPDSAFTATSVKQKPQTYWGASHRRPIVAGNAILFADASNQIVRTLTYSFEIDGFTGSNVGILAPHLLEDKTIVDWCYANAPDNRVYIVRSDGKALTVTYDQEQEVTAWTQWDTKGKFESCASLRRGDDEAHDQVFFVVKRTINGRTVRYIEELDTTGFVDVEDAFFVDSGLTYDSPVEISGVTRADPGVITTSSAHGLVANDYVDFTGIVWVAETDEYENESQPDQLNGRRYQVNTAPTATTFTIKDVDTGVAVSTLAFLSYIEGGEVRKAVLTISGLSHLATEEVEVLADGGAETYEISEDGVLTLDARASRVHVGLKYVADLETLDIESPGGGTIQGMRKKVNYVIVRMERSRGLLVGPNSEKLIEMKQRLDENYDEPTALLTGDSDPIFLKPDWNSHGRVFLRQIYPLPMTILAVIPNFEVGTRGDN